MKRVLIVDDKEENVYYLQVLLKGHGYDVETARHGAEALVKARQRPPDFIVSDLLMPVMDGYTLLRHWKADARLSRIPFIVYTATYTEPDDERLARRLGADSFILKPAEPEAFIQSLQETERRPPQPSDETAQPAGPQNHVLKEYSETLIRKLEDKSLQLEEANRVLCESEERFRQMAENMNEVFWMSDTSKNLVIYVSPAYEKIWGRSRESLYASPRAWIDAIHPDDRPAVVAATGKQAAGQYDETYRILRPDGAMRWIRDRASAVRRPDGQVYRIAGIAEDITERKLAEQALRQSQARFSTVFASSPIAIGITSQKTGRILDVNESQCQLFGRSREEMIGRTGDELNFWVDPEERLAVIARVAAEGSVRNIEARFRHRSSGPRDVLLSVETVAFAGEADPVLIWMGNDITERKQIESQLLRSQRMESIGTLAGGIAHDLNNVLTPVLMAIEILKLDERDSGRLELLATIETSARRGAEMVRQVLSFARGVEGRRIEVQIRHLLRDIAKIANDTFLKNIQASVEAPAELWPVTGDPTQLHQVLLNLAVNARDAMPNGGVLRLSAENLQVSAASGVLPPGARPGPYVAIRVEDSGAGMAPEVLDRIFEPFFTTKEPGKGTGLGLSTTLAIVKSHGGFIRVQSEPGQGTAFSVFIPARGQAESRAEPAVAPELPRGQGELVLVVDDEYSVREIARRTLEAFGYRALLAADGAEAVKHFADRRAEVAVALVDMMMPVLDGNATVTVLQKMRPGLPVIGASGLGTSAIVANAKAAGVRQFLPKPYTADALLNALRSVLDERPKEGI